MSVDLQELHSPGTQTRTVTHESAQSCINEVGSVAKGLVTCVLPATTQVLIGGGCHSHASGCYQVETLTQMLSTQLSPLDCVRIFVMS